MEPARQAFRDLGRHIQRPGEMTEPTRLTAGRVLDIHSDQLARFGGPHVMRDSGLLEPALMHPVNRYVHGQRNLTPLAAIMPPALPATPPFANGNKHSDFATFAVFLGLNGISFGAALAHATASVLALAAGEVDENMFTRRVRDQRPQTL